MKIPWPWLALFTCSALRQDIEERRSSQDELSAVRAIASYHREGMSLALKNLVSVPPKSCGSILTSVLPVDPTFETQIRRKASLYFRIHTIKQNGKEVKVVYGKGTSWATEQVLGRLLKVGDFDATYMRSLQDFEAHLFRRKSPFGSVTFEVGTDLRSCWGDLYDWEDRKVCDVASLKDLLEDVKKQSEMKMDAVGKSGAAIVTNLRRFILKNLQEEEDPFLVREVIPNFATSIGEKDRDNAGCFKTAVAPICAVLDIPDAVHPGKRVHWVVMRKIELPGQQRSYFQLKDDDDQIDFQDLKGPKFTGLRDGKTFASKKGLGSAQVWHRKDAGFVSLFPTGMRLAYCGSKEAARTLQLDSEMLKNEQMTDYSLFLLPYERGNTRKCFCDDKPRWPLILDTDPYGLRMAVGIIDYLERKVSWFENMFGFSMSTMKEPAEYQNWWMRMWPTYFHLCDFKVNDQGQITGGGHTEQLKIGDRVVALEKIKWFGDVEEARSRQKFNGKWKKCYFGLAYEGSKYKVYPGAKGTVMSFESCRAAGAGLVINWDKYKWRNKVFQVDPSSVMGEVRQLQRGLA